MDRQQLADQDLAVLGACLHATVDGPYFPEWEFHTLMGLSRADVAEIAKAWPEAPADYPPHFESSDDAVRTAITNAANMLLGYPHGVSRDQVESDLGYSLPEVAQALTRWLDNETFDPSGKGFFDRLA